jgi:hypothetical protein
MAYKDCPCGKSYSSRSKFCHFVCGVGGCQKVTLKGKVCHAVERCVCGKTFEHGREGSADPALCHYKCSNCGAKSKPGTPCGCRESEQAKVQTSLYFAFVDLSDEFERLFKFVAQLEINANLYVSWIYACMQGYDFHFITSKISIL